MSSPEIDQLRFLAPAQCFQARESFGSPCFVYSLEGLEEQAEQALAFPNPYGLTVRFAMKACPNAAILKIFRNKGLHIDASSTHEVSRALKAGYQADQISLSTQNLPSSGEEVRALLQIGVAKEQQPHYMRILTLPDHDPSDLIRFGLAIIGERSGAARRGQHGHEHGVMSCVRTYEAPLDRRLADDGFEQVARVTLLMKEALVRVAEPSMVPAV